MEEMLVKYEIEDLFFDGGSGGRGQSITAHYPLGDLEIGQSFLVPLSERVKVRQAVNTFHAFGRGRRGPARGSQD